MKLIVDASVAVKWLFTEERSVESRQLLAHRIVLHAPDFVLTEAANVTWKKARRKEISDAQLYLEALARLPDAVELYPSADLVAHASAIALKIDHPIYDCLYLACAEVEGAPLVTADGKLRDAARTYPGVDVWHIAAPEFGERIVTAATALVIQETTVQKLIAAYTTFSDTADFVIDTVPRRRIGVRILTPEDQDGYFDTPAYLRLVKLIVNLSYDERIDLMALAWFGRQTSEPSPGPTFCSMRTRWGSTIPITKRYWVATGTQGSTACAQRESLPRRARRTCSGRWPAKARRGPLRTWRPEFWLKPGGIMMRAVDTNAANPAHNSLTG